MSIDVMKGIQRSESIVQVISALHYFFQEQNQHDKIPELISTRKIADQADLSIYKTRHILLKLEQDGIVTCIKQSRSLFWQKTK